MGIAVGGLHHITSITRSARRNVAFYRGVLGLRLIKRTVNFDDPGTWHLYFGDAVGSPGTAITFFAWQDLPVGKRGAGEIGAVAYAVPTDALPFWRQRLEDAGAPVTELGERFGEPVLGFEDESGGPVEIIGTDDPGPARKPWTTPEIDAAHAIRGFHAPTLSVSDPVPTAEILIGLLGMRKTHSEEGRVRFAAGPDGAGFVVDLQGAPDGRSAQQGAGSVHHIAFRVPDEAAQRKVQEAVARAGLLVTPVQDRTYFKAIYFREPGGILFEVATDAPGFTVDEDESLLGSSLKLPARHEPLRALLQKSLPPLE